MTMRSIVEHSSRRLPIAGPSLHSPARLLRFHESRPRAGPSHPADYESVRAVHGMLACAILAARVGSLVPPDALLLCPVAAGGMTERMTAAASGSAGGCR